jgi:DNA repair protein RadC
MGLTIHGWPRSERPRERLLQAGPQSLSDGELLAVLLGTGTREQNVAELARGLLDRWGDLATLLGSSPAELASAKGLGPARVARLLAALEVGRRYLAAPQAARSALAAPVDAARYFKARLLDLPHEVFSCLFLDTATGSFATKSCSAARSTGYGIPREVVKRALQHNAAAVIVGHNHPSGVSEPSEADRNITLKLAKALALVEIRLLDHLVVSRSGHVSLAERGLI